MKLSPPTFRTLAVALTAGTSLFAQGCLDRPIDTLEPHTTATVNEVIPYGRVDKIDLLLAIDDSISMSDKQEILRLAVPNLVARFTNPICVGPDGPVADNLQPATGTDPCPAHSEREFPPLTDLHVGIISSSLGSFSGDTCTNDHAHLLTRGAEPSPPPPSFLTWDAAGGGLDGLEERVVGVGQVGCGYEMPLEAMLRFLVDPHPYAQLDESLQPKGLDQALLDQRAAFLRPDSLVAVVLLSDENDCSVNPTISDWKKSGITPNSRCWKSPDALYPTRRYVNALSLRTIDPSRPDFAPVGDAEGIANPLLASRSPELVFFAAIVGVPWQALAKKDDSGQPSLARGLLPVPELKKSGVLQALTGDPDQRVPPSDPFMVESLERRSGTSSILGASPSEPNAINGSDRETLSTSQLQYSCIFELPTPENDDSGDCKEVGNPLCADINGTMMKVKAKAMPGLRQLAVVSGLDRQGIAASVCPAQIVDDKRADFGYSPAAHAIVETLKSKLVDHQCLPFSLETDDSGEGVACLVIEAKPRSQGICQCGAGFDGELDATTEAVRQIQNGEFYRPDQDCFCQVAQLDGKAGETCRESAEGEVPEGVDGFCYIDATLLPPLGNVDLVQQCAPNERRIVRMVGHAVPASDSSTHLWCASDSE